MTIPNSPTTPSRKRRSLRQSSIDEPNESFSPSPYTSGTTNGTTFSRRSSRTSQTSFQPQSPITPRPMSSRSSRYSLHRRKSSRESVNSFGSIGPQLRTNGMGNLADELEDAWDQDEAADDMRDNNFLDDLREGEVDQDSAIIDCPYDDRPAHNFDHGGMPQSPLPQDHNSSNQLNNRSNLPIPSSKPSHKRTDSAYDGSDYGPSSDASDEEALPPLLRKRIREIDRLVRSSSTSAASDSLAEQGGVILRTVGLLRDLGPPQSNIEYGVTRMVTSYNSMAVQRANETRGLFGAAHFLVNYGGSAAGMGVGAGLLVEDIDVLLEEVNMLGETLALPFLPNQIQQSQPPKPTASQTHNPLLPLHHLSLQTSDLSSTLRNITDLLQEHKLAANVASRKLKSVQAMVEEMRMEAELVEGSMLLIQAGDWDRRCRERQAARLCREVVEGFGERWGVDVPRAQIQGVGVR